MGKNKFNDYGLSRDSKPKGNGGQSKNNSYGGYSNGYGSSSGGRGGYSSNNYNRDRSARPNGGFGATANNKIVAKPTDEKATAPYNFVSLPHAVVVSELDQGIAWAELKGEERRKCFANYLSEKGTLNGTLELDLETLTPFFIGGNHENRSETFGPMGMPIIPGSTLRGLVKNIFKIITCGAMRRNEDFNDHHLYFRCLMAPKSMPWLEKLHAYYQSRMTHETDQVVEKEIKLRDGSVRKKTEKLVVKNAKPGFLIRRNRKYYICPAEMRSIKSREYGPIPKKSRVDWHDREKEAVILTGANKNKNYVRIVGNADWENPIPVPDDVIQDYKDDRNRRGVDLLKVPAMKVNGEANIFTGRKLIDQVAPCFYIVEDGKVVAFGHGRSFRIPYRNWIGDNVPLAQQSAAIDFADAVKNCGLVE